VQLQIFSLYSQGKLKPHISQTFRLDDFARALTALRNAQAQGKIILTTAS